MYCIGIHLSTLVKVIQDVYILVCDDGSKICHQKVDCYFTTAWVKVNTGCPDARTFSDKGIHKIPDVLILFLASDIPTVLACFFFPDVRCDSFRSCWLWLCNVSRNVYEMTRDYLVLKFSLASATDGNFRGFGVSAFEDMGT
jgi:hypothetical protein